jgi:GDP-4-dehydro-6-deoxy-D-mannose reductase
MQTILVTGVNGFVGKHLARELKQRGAKVLGLGRDSKADPSIEGLIENYFSCDLLNATEVGRLPLQSVDAIINLAGLAKIGESFNNPELYKQVNVGVLSVLGDELLKKNLHDVPVLAISTGAVYSSNQPMPITEEAKLVEDGSPYALSKIMMERAAQKLNEQDLSCIIARPFNHIGPGQEEGFLVPDLYKKIKASQENGQPVRVGNLKTRRDYTDVRDVVRAYADLALAPHLGFDIYNICSGRSVAGEEILNMLLSKMQADVSVEVDQSFFRQNDPANIYGSYERLKGEVGWQPKIPLKQTIGDFLADKA